MKAQCAQSPCKELFLTRFKQRLGELMANHYSPARGFGPAWEQTLSTVPLNEQDQGSAYWELITWVHAGKLFTTPSGSELLATWSESLHDA